MDKITNHPILNRGEIKIVITGSVGSGKTTAINAISQVPVIGTETKASEQNTLQRKQTTTVAMEYGITHVKDAKLHIYGTPGQKRFDFMADILCKGASGIAVMIDNGCHDPLKEMNYYLDQHSEFLSEHSGIIGITHFDDLHTRTSLLDYHRYVREQGFTCPIMKLDARNKNEVKMLLQYLLSQIEKEKVF